LVFFLSILGNTKKGGIFMKRLLLMFCFLFSLLVSGTIQAAVVTDPGGYGGDTSITNLEILGLGTYDVEFIYGTYASIFGIENFDFAEPTDAQTAVTSICSTLNDAGVGSIYTTDLSTIGKNSFYIPTLDGSIIKIVKGTTGSPWHIWDGIMTEFTIDDNHMYADLEMVPIPPALWLLGSGLIGMVGIRRKIRQ
jgi:hypothetical protein